ncbi:hypothetical protein VB711_19095 [Cronbergia sp. UHCC 0137]|uniref:hypothetical protein n=1 Tax=Cronbergia sp. UHCC 0137 TaxID=3110239 RepID=UPI002B1F267B|nr:hypothetical protein [Cronbergia sp. UHCC 0137]MEA5619935.1 hypothetical protein [Cronbergia sp. UHCC 0137]
MLKSAKLTTTTGYTWETSISATASYESTIEYFLRKYFDVGIYPVENLEKVVKVEIFNGKTTVVCQL